MDTFEAPSKGVDLIVGTRLVVRSKTDWRQASIAAFNEHFVVINVCSATGRTYKLKRPRNIGISHSCDIPTLETNFSEDWRTNFAIYDKRW